MNKDSNILAEKYEAINDSFNPFKDGRPPLGPFYKRDKRDSNPFLKDEEGEPTPSKYDKAKELAKKGGELAKKGAKKGIRAAGRTYGAYKVGKDYLDKRSQAASDVKNASRLYATEFLKGEQSYQDLNNRYGIDDAEMYDLLKKARIPVTAFGMYRGKAGRGVDVYNDYINKYKPAPMQKLGRGIKSFANYFKGKKKPEA